MTVDFPIPIMGRGKVDPICGVKVTRYASALSCRFLVVTEEMPDMVPPLLREATSSQPSSHLSIVSYFISRWPFWSGIQQPLESTLWPPCRQLQTHQTGKMLVKGVARNHRRKVCEPYPAPDRRLSSWAKLGGFSHGVG